jgi:hypothetical protein
MADVRRTAQGDRLPAERPNLQENPLKRRTFLGGAALSLVTPFAAAATDVSGVAVDDEITFDNQKLVLNGVGIRRKYGFSVYVCALYLTQKRHTLAEVIALPGPKKILATMLREISSDDLGDALLSGIRHNSTPDQTQRIGAQLVALGQLFGSIPRLKKGDSFSVAYAPQSGTLIEVNGKPALAALPDVAFFEALLRIWLGDDPADSGLKPLMLGIKPESSTSGGRSGG